ncbi:hypothetical protein HDU85_005938 [Gaertneriomyces sp. JEL0708]|nr:hypothetical protein HDU85_005938 [Gaertneriomyces sp. JEL0708]
MEFLLGFLLLIGLWVSTVHGKAYAGGAGKAIYFYDTTNIASISTAQTVTGLPTDAITIEFWAKPIISPNPQQIYTLFSLAVHGYDADGVDLGVDDNFLTWTTDRTLWFMSKWVYQNGFSLAAGEPDIVTHFNQWQHWGERSIWRISLTGDVKLYRDDNLLVDSNTVLLEDELAASTLFEGIPLSSDAAIVFGQDQDAYYGTFSPSKAYLGLIDEVRIWSVARTFNEIEAKRGLSLDPATSGLWGSWRMDRMPTANEIPNEVTLMPPIRLGGVNPFPNEPVCPPGDVGVSEADHCNRIPRWVQSDAPVIGSGYVFQMVARNQLVEVPLPGATDTSASLTYRIITNVDSDCPDWLFYIDRDYFPFHLGLGAVDIRTPNSATGRCEFEYEVNDGSSPPVVAAVTLDISEPPVVRPHVIEATEGDSGLYVKLTGVNKDQSPPTNAIITQLPGRGVIYTAKQQRIQSFTRVNKLGLGDIFEPGAAVLEYVPLPNEFGSPFDTVKFKLENSAEVLSDADEIITINLAMSRGVPAIAAINPYYLTFADDHVLVIPTLNLLAMSDFTIEMWTWPDPGSSGAKTIWKTQDGAYRLSLTANDEFLTFYVNNAALITGPKLESRTWAHVAVSRANDGTYTLFVDGESVSSAVRAGTVTGSGGITVGKQFEGGIDEIAVFKSANVIGPHRLLHQRITKDEADLVAVWHFSEGRGGSADCESPSDVCEHVAALGGGNVPEFPTWTSAPASSSVAGYEGFPSLSTFAGTENDERIVIQLNAFTSDSDTRLLALTINSLPTLGTLYQYDPSNPPTYLGPPIKSEFQVWRSSVSREPQWASRVAKTPSKQGLQYDPTLQFSTQYGPGDYGAHKILGPPSTYDSGKRNRGYGDSIEAWCPATAGNELISGNRRCHNPNFVSTTLNPFNWHCPLGTEREFIDVGFTSAAHAMEVAMYENYNPGSTEAVRVRDMSTGEWVAVWEGNAQVELYDQNGNYIAQTYRIFSPKICGTPFRTDAVRIERATWKLPGWKEIDAVQLVGTPEMEVGYVLDPEQRVIYVPDRDVDGIDTFAFGATDCIGDPSQLSTPSPVNVFLKSLVHKPTSGEGNIAAYEIKRGEGGTAKTINDLEISLQAYNRDGRPSKFLFTKMPKHGMLRLTSGEVLPVHKLLEPTSIASLQRSALDLTYSVTKGCGEDSFTYVIDDGVEQSDPIPISLTVWCLPFTDYSDPMGIVVILLTGISLVGVFLSAGLTFWRAQHPVFRAASPTFLGLILAGLCLVFMSNILYGGMPSRAKCMAAPALLALGFAIAMGGLCVKNWRVYFIFSSRKLRKKSNTDNKRLLQFTAALIIPNIIILAVWGAVDPARPVLLDAGTPKQYYVCSSKSQVPSAALIAYNGLILLVTAIFAFLNRNVNLKYNESKQLAIAAYNVLIFCIFGFPLVLIGGTPPNIVFIVRGLAIWCSAFIALVIIFVPKAWLTLRASAVQAAKLRSPSIATSIRAADILKPDAGARGMSSSEMSSEQSTLSGTFNVQTMNVVQQKVVVRVKRAFIYGAWAEYYAVLLPNTKTLIFHSENDVLSYRLTTDTPTVQLLAADPEVAGRTLRLQFTNTKVNNNLEVQVKTENDATNWSTIIQKTKESGASQSVNRPSLRPPQSPLYVTEVGKHAPTASHGATDKSQREISMASVSERRDV